MLSLFLATRAVVLFIIGGAAAIDNVFNFKGHVKRHG
jgi:hypothetical protein